MDFVVGGFHPSPIDPRDYKITYGAGEKKLPVSWKPNVNFTIHNQGKINSCVGHALCAQYEMKNNPAMAYGHIYGNRKYTDHMGEGLICRDALKTIQKDGVPTFKSYPHNAEVPEIIELFKKHSAGVASEAAKYKIGAYYRLNSVEECKQAMYDGYGVVFGLYLFKGMIDMDKGTDPMVIAPKLIDGFQMPEMIGGHLVSGFGWDTRGLRFANSWSSGWGEKGYGYITNECFNWSIENNFPIPLVEAWAFSFNASEVTPPKPSVDDGWYKQDGKWRYRKAGVDVTGWLNDRGTWYYLDINGYMKTGWVSIDTKWYYFDSNGAMATGWRKISNYWYYMANSGEMVTGYQMVNGKPYLFNTGIVKKQPVGSMIATDSSGALLIY